MFHSLPFIVVTGISFLAIINIARFLSGKKPKFYRFPYSNFNYYVAVSVFFIGALLEDIYIKDLEKLFLFFIFSFSGVMGETVFSVTWHILFKVKFWEYQVSTIFRAYSSLLNFIPWGLGGLLYLDIASLLRLRVYVKDTNSILYSVLIFILFYIILLVFRLLTARSTNLRFRNFTLINYFYYLFPYIASFSFLVLTNFRFFYLLLIYGTVVWFAEYFFGKYCTFFVSKRLWIYNFKAFDHGHITFLSMIPFAMGGIYFLAVYKIVYMLNLI